MKRLFQRVASHIKTLSAAPKARRRKVVRGRFEALEDRLLMASSAELQAEAYRQITTMTQLAQAIGTPRTTPTELFINFEGGSYIDDAKRPPEDKFPKVVTPFEVDQPNREQHIQQILFGVSEMFAPFNVQVSRLMLPGHHLRSNGSTTVFVGDNHGNTGFINGQLVNFSYAGTDYYNVDYPSVASRPAGTSGGLNDDAFNLAFVDPIKLLPDNTVASEDINWIVQSIAHEAGHTFGLTHVEPLANGLLFKDAMAYGAPNLHFRNNDLDIKDENNGGSGPNTTTDELHPQWHFSILDVNPATPGGVLGGPSQGSRPQTIEGDVRIQKQNSYSYLTYMLGARPADDVANIANPSSVDERTYHDRLSPNIYGGPNESGYAYSGAIERKGDYDVYTLYALSNQRLLLTAAPDAGSSLDTVLMVYSEDGKNLLHYNNSYLSDTLSMIALQPVAGQKFKVVVGSSNGRTTGNYVLGVSPDRTYGTASAPMNLLDVAGTSGDDTITLRRAAEDYNLVEAVVNGERRYLTQLAALTSGINIRAGEGHDRINVEDSAAGIAVRIFAGAGNDSIYLSPVVNHLDWLKGEVFVDAGTGSDGLYLNDQASPYSDPFTLTATSISRPFSGRVNFDATLESLSLFAGSGSNTVTVLAAPSGTTALLNGGGGQDTLAGPNFANDWTINGPNAGHLNWTIGFSSMENLKGSASSDRFAFLPGYSMFSIPAGSISGMIDGHGGSDTLDYAAYSAAVLVDLSLGRATAVTGGVRNIEHARGGWGNDVLLGNQADNILIGNGGNDRLVGADGNDLLIGGYGADQLEGGLGEDLLIGGVYAYEHHTAALLAILAEWGRRDQTAAARASRLRNGGGLNGAYVLNGNTVFDDSSYDSLIGGAQTDWFFANYDATDANSSDLVN